MREHEACLADLQFAVRVAERIGKRKKARPTVDELCDARAAQLQGVAQQATALLSALEVEWELEEGQMKRDVAVVREALEAVASACDAERLHLDDHLATEMQDAMALRAAEEKALWDTAIRAAQAQWAASLPIPPHPTTSPPLPPYCYPATPTTTIPHHPITSTPFPHSTPSHSISPLTPFPISPHPNASPPIRT